MRKMGLYKDLEFYTGPVLHDEEKTTRCIRALEAKAKKLGYFRIRYNSWDHLTAYTDNPYMDPNPMRIEYVLELEPGPRCFKEKIKRKRKRSIRKARRDGLALVEDSGKENILLLYEMMDNSKRVRDGKGYPKYYENIIPFLNKRVMENLIDNQVMRLFQVYRGEKPLSSGAMVSYGKKAFGLFMGITDEGYRLNASSLLLHDLASKVMDEGKTYLNIGGVPLDHSGDNLSWFKMSLGANEYPVASGKSDFLQNKLYKYIQDIYDTISTRA
jgi:lipid II:glycine glycyltransferase (peptidoglycan interpeptide bridge formation enzyme)